MCGIYGTTRNYNDQQIKDKLKRTAFRGPDKMGFNRYTTPNQDVIFGHNRLSIIDLDPRSDQPFTYMKHIHIVFNGEIYNFKALKQRLLNKGYQFNTTSDTEVVCAAYLEFGEDCVKHFNGMFALVILDEKNNLLFGARDRMGQKPFYYILDNRGDMEFSSQVSSMQMYNPDLTISEKAISYYLAWRSIPEPLSIFNEIKKLHPGHSFKYDLNTKTFKDKRYWDIDYKSPNNYAKSFEEASEELKEILSDAVSKRLFADVPVGVFLSGGIDSSLVAALATKTSSSEVKTFSVKFQEAEFDESKYAQQVADHLKTDHHVIECNYNEGMELIDNFCHFYDEPFSDSSAIPSMLLAKYTRQHVTVALSGDAGDESFIGYHRYQWAKKQSKLYKLPLGLRNLASKGLKVSSNYKANVISKALQFENVNKAYLSVLTGVDLSWIDTDTDYYDLEELKYLEHDHKNLIERISDFDLKTYLNWDINTKVDRATMAFSLEARSPLMDHRVIEFARTLPTDFKYGKHENQKRILKDVLYKHVPSDIFNRPKSGFTMPFSRWFKEDLKDFVLDELSVNGLQQIPSINTKEVQFRIDQHMNGTWDRYPMIWRLIVLKQWLSKNGKGYTIK